MSKLSKTLLESVDNLDSYIEEDIKTSMTIYEALSSILARKVSPSAKRIPIGWKWWSRGMQQDFINALGFFGMYTDEVKEAVNKTEPIPGKPLTDEERREGIETLKSTLTELANRMKEYFDQVGATNYKIGRVGEYQGNSRMVVFDFCSFPVIIVNEEEM